ncbi:Hypothetical protein NocV09_07500090 [Nannochloropsis oceanica]
MTTPAPAVPEQESKEIRAEWRVFIPMATKLSQETLGDVFDGPYDKRKGDGMEGRSDVYIAVNPAIGLKRRGAKGRVELKLLTEDRKEGEEEDIKGIEHWKKFKIGKGLAEEESLAQVHTLLEAHGLIDSHVTSLLASEDGTKSVEVAKLRVGKVYEDHGVLVEDCLVEAEGKQYRSFAVEGNKEKVKAFLSSHAVGKKMYELAMTQKEAVLHGYPNFVCKCACL